MKVIQKQNKTFHNINKESHKVCHSEDMSSRKDKEKGLKNKKPQVTINVSFTVWWSLTVFSIFHRLDDVSVRESVDGLIKPGPCQTMI